MSFEIALKKALVDLQTQPWTQTSGNTPIDFGLNASTVHIQIDQNYILDILHLFIKAKNGMGYPFNSKLKISQSSPTDLKFEFSSVDTGTEHKNLIKLFTDNLKKITYEGPLSITFSEALDYALEQIKLRPWEKVAVGEKILHGVVFLVPAEHLDQISKILQGALERAYAPHKEIYLCMKANDNILTLTFDATAVVEKLPTKSKKEFVTELRNIIMETNDLSNIVTSSSFFQPATNPQQVKIDSPKLR
jgi:hypothetical protein